MFKSYKAKMILYWVLLTVLTLVSIIPTYFIPWWGPFFGWVYSFAFALSALPQCRKSIKEGHSQGVADGTLKL